MKKLTKPLISLVMTILLVLSVVPATFAADKQRVFDNEKIFGQRDLDVLESTAAELDKLFDIDVILVTHPDFGGKDVSEYSKDFCKDNVINENSVVLVCSFNLGKLNIKADGKSLDAISNAELQEVNDHIVPTLREDPFGTIQEFYRDIYALHEETYGVASTPSEDTSSSDVSNEPSSSADATLDSDSDEIAPRSERPHIFDNDVIYDSENILIFESLATDMFNKYNVDVIVANDTDFSGGTAKDYATFFSNKEEFLDDNIVLAYSHSLGDLYIIPSGRCIDIFTKNDLDYLVSLVTKNLRKDPTLATTEFLMNVATYLANDAEGVPTTLANGFVSDNDTNNSDSFYSSYPILTIALVILIPLIIAFVVCLLIYRKYTLAGSQYHYPLNDRGSINLTRSEDIFLREHTTVVKIPRDNNSSSSGGGGGGSRNSSGGSGGKF